MHTRGPLQHLFTANLLLRALQRFGKKGVHMGGPLTLAKNRALCVFLWVSWGVQGTQEAARDLINNCRALTNCQGFGFDINGHTLPWQKRQAFPRVYSLADSDTNTQHLRQQHAHIPRRGADIPTNRHTRKRACAAHANKCPNSRPIRLQMYTCMDANAAHAHFSFHHLTGVWR